MKNLFVQHFSSGSRVIAEKETVEDVLGQGFLSLLNAVFPRYFLIRSFKRKHLSRKSQCRFLKIELYIFSSGDVHKQVMLLKPPACLFRYFLH